MHHNIINIHDIAYIITEHILNTVGKITTFDLVELLPLCINNAEFLYCESKIQ